ncbi:MAG: protein-disulfide reductase DsbD [Proteobacteria bacterium]|nr:protein-disulfide reductase DsbD [Pseudomonadota bacterium]
MKKNISALFFLLLFTSFATFAINQDDLLTAEDAFSSEVIEINQDNFTLRFNIADKYYLYKHAFKFPNDGNDVEFLEAKIPVGKKKTDDFFGEVETYYQQVDIVIPFNNPEVKHSTTFKYKYQGCADVGVCYPPETKTIELKLPVAQISNNNPFGLDKNQGSLWGGQQNSVLPEDQAFILETIAIDASTLSARFTMSDNVYLYKDKVILTSLTDGISIDTVEFPKGEMKDDPYFGEVEVFFNQIEVVIGITRNTDAKVLQLQAEFQGCVDEGICYPPSTRTIDISLSEDIVIPLDSSTEINNITQLSEQDQIQADLSENSWWKTILKFFGFGLLLALTPCVFPMIPILSGLIMGQGEITRSKSFILALVYVLAMALAYTVAGVIAGMLGANIQAALQKPAVIVAFSLIFVVLAMSMFGYYDLQLPSSWQNKLSKLSNKQKSGSYIGVAIMGFVSAIIVGPCVAPPLAGAVLYISNTGDPIVGGFALFAMSIGMGVPLLLIGATAGKWMPQSGGWMNVVKSFFGIALIAMAIWFLSRIIPGHIALALYGVLALLASIFWIKYAMKNISSKKMTAFFLLLKVLLIALGTVQIIGAIKGNTDPLRPLTTIKKFEFVKISSVAELEQAITNSNKPVLLDFYADWCADCIQMERVTYSDPIVQATLDKFLVLKADVTQQNDADKALMKKFQIIGPPATLFFGIDNQLIKQYSFFGFKNAEDFVQHLNKI